MKQFRYVIGFALIGLACIIFTGCSDLTQFSEAEVKEAAIVIGGEGCPGHDAPVPLMIVDNEIINDLSIDSLNPESIHSISVVKGEEAIALYGSAGENGVVQITTKQKHSDLKQR